MAMAVALADEAWLDRLSVGGAKPKMNASGVLAPSDG